jgi:hypothetical protein
MLSAEMLDLLLSDSMLAIYGSCKLIVAVKINFLTDGIVLIYNE